MTLPKQFWPAVGSLLMATAIWIPAVHLFFKPGASGPGKISREADALAARHLALWIDPAQKQHELARMRRSNAEWDFMGRTFLVWSLGEMGLAEPSRIPQYLPVIDEIIDETLKLERKKEMYIFLMPYARSRPYVVQPARSLFVDGEIALMLAVRRMLAEKVEYQPLLKDRLNLVLERMRTNEGLAAESYPDECWMFDHLVALAALRVSDFLDGTDHSAFFDQWLRVAKAKYVHPQTGLLVSSYSTKGTALDGPEGSSIWLVAHCLRLLDPKFAADQYQKARRELGCELMGFSWSREWPKSWKGPLDIDSGMVIPILDVSAGGSGLAFIAARSFGDDDYFEKLETTIRFAGFPHERQGQLKYCASNQVGDAALLFAHVLGPMWTKIQGGGRR